MTPQRLSVKLFAQRGSAIDLPGLIPVFHKWITEGAMDDLLIDVADYKHVHHGPGIMLIGHEVDYGLDLQAGRPGLLVTLKRQRDPSLTSAVETALSKLLVVARLLQDDPSISPAIPFDAREIEVTLLDRLRYPNTEESAAVVVDQIGSTVGGWLGVSEWSAERVADDPRLPLAIRVKLPSVESLPPPPSADAEYTG